jgi:hypothetical protein
LSAAAEVLGLADLVDGCLGKRHEPEVEVDFAVDDDAGVVESYGGYRVEPFGGGPRRRGAPEGAQSRRGQPGVDLGTP